MNLQGELAALLTAMLWTITALAFERASLRIGSLAVNITRIFLGFLFLSVITFFYRGMLLPVDAGFDTWKWLLISGVVGFVFGDIFLFKSYTIIGSRFAMLVMTLAPPITALCGWVILGEKLSLLNYLGMLLTIAGIALAIFARDAENKKKIKLKLSAKGLLFAFLGAVGQALGLVLSKLGMKDYDPFAATQIRLIAGMFGFMLIVSVLGRWKQVFKACTHVKGMTSTAIGAFFGPCLGVSFSLVAAKHTDTGIAATIMSIVPVLILPPVILLYKQKVSWLEAIGAFVSVIGVSLFFINTQ